MDAMERLPDDNGFIAAFAGPSFSDSRAYLNPQSKLLIFWTRAQASHSGWSPQLRD